MYARRNQTNNQCPTGKSRSRKAGRCRAWQQTLAESIGLACIHGGIKSHRITHGGCRLHFLLAQRGGRSSNRCPARTAAAISPAGGVSSGLAQRLPRDAGAAAPGAAGDAAGPAPRSRTAADAAEAASGEGCCAGCSRCCRRTRPGSRGGCWCPRARLRTQGRLLVPQRPPGEAGPAAAVALTPGRNRRC